MRRVRQAAAGRSTYRARCRALAYTSASTNNPKKSGEPVLIPSFVRQERQGAVLRLVLDRPQARNAIATVEDCDALTAALEGAQDEHGINCIVLTGSGSAFCAGGDIKAIKRGDGIGPKSKPDATRATYRRGIQRMIRALWDCEIPIVAAVNGPAIGLGCDLATICDLRIASERASFASTFIRLGLIPGDGGAWILSRAVGPAKAAEMILTGDALDAEQALAAGLVSRVVPDTALQDEAIALGGKIAARPARTLRLAKRLLRESQHLRLSDVLELSSAYQALAHETDDHREAVDAFLEKREPRFTGR